MTRLSLTPDGERPNKNDPQVWTVEQLANCAWFQDLMREYRDDLERCLAVERGRHPDLRHEREQLDQKLRGWALSLANPNLPQPVRSILEEDLNRALRRQQEIDAMLSADESREQCLEDLLDPKLVVERLNRLSEIVANGNPTRSNLELALHIDRIDGFQDGRVVLRTCKLGAFDGAVEQLTFGQESSTTDSPKPSDQMSISRRRALLNVDDGLEIGSLDSTNHFATDPNRFTGLPDHWFFIDEFQIPIKQSWAETHALVVAQYRIDNKASIAEAAEHFKRARDTIKNAVRIAKSKGLDSSEARGDLPCKPCWAAIHAEEVAAFMRQPLVIQKNAAEHFGKSLPTIIKALKIARERQIGPANSQDATDAA